VATSIAILPTNRKTVRKTVWIAAVVAIVAAAVELPAFGVPLGLGTAIYAWIRLSKPYAVLRGRTLSPRQQRHAAVIAGGTMLGIGALFSGALYALDLANTLEHRLQDALKAAHSRGELRPGQLFEECNLVCAQAVVVEIAARNKPGIAKLRGYAAHDHTIYQWRGSTGPESNTAYSADTY
jgi:uncharacterized membrane protein YgdD (TMEM256/DUF423 family)